MLSIGFQGQHEQIVLASPTEDLNIRNSRPRSSASFFSLPGEIRNMIYPEVLVDSRSHLQRMLFENDRSKPRQKALYPAILSTCRKTYEEGLAYLYADNEFLVNIWPDLACYPNSQPPISHKNFSLTRNLHVKIYHNPDESMTESDMRQIQSHVRRLCMTLLASNVLLENMRITIPCAGLHLSHTEKFHRDILRPLKELRVSGTFEIHNSSPIPTEETTSQYLADIESIVRGKGLPKEGIPAKTSTLREMYQDLVDTVKGFRQALSQIADATPPTDAFAGHQEFTQRLAHLSATLELHQHHAPPLLADDPASLTQLDIKAILLELEELYNVGVPTNNNTQWGSKGFSSSSSSETEETPSAARSVFEAQLTALREWLYMRPEFQDLGPEGAPCESHWENVVVKEVEAEEPLFGVVGPWGV